MYAKFQLHPPYGFRDEDFSTVLRKPFMPPRQPIKFNNFDKSHMKRRGLLNKHFCKNNPNIPIKIEKIVNFLFSHYKSRGAISCDGNQSSYPTRRKNIIYVVANVL